MTAPENSGTAGIPFLHIHRGSKENMLTFMKYFRYIFVRAGIAQLVEYKLPKLGVAGSNPVARSIIPLDFSACIGIKSVLWFHIT
jgi:hypothetical protein